jgi:hypothetical protein
LTDDYCVEGGSGEVSETKDGTAVSKADYPIVGIARGIGTVIKDRGGVGLVDSEDACSLGDGDLSRL